MAPRKTVTRISVPKKKPEDLIKDFKENNNALAKKLSYWRGNYNMVLKERNQLQKENMEVLVQNKNLECRLKNVVIWARGLLDCIVKGSEFTTNIICHADLEQLALIAKQNKLSNEEEVESQAKKRLSGEIIKQNPVVNITRLPDDLCAKSRVNVEDYHEPESLSTTPDEDHSEHNGESETQKELEDGEIYEDEDDEELDEEEEEEEGDENNADENQSNSDYRAKRLNTLIEESSSLNSTTCNSPEKTLVAPDEINEVKITVTSFHLDKSAPLKRKSSSGTLQATSPQMVTKRSRRNMRSNTSIPVATNSPDSVVSPSSSKSSIANNQTPSLSTVIDNLSDNFDSEQASSKKNSFELSNRTLLSPGFSQRKSQSMATSTPFEPNISTVQNDTTENTFPTTPVKHTRNAASRKKLPISSKINTSSKSKLNDISPASLPTRLRMRTSSPRKSRQNSSVRTSQEILSSPPRRQPRTARPKSLKEVSLRHKLRRK